MARVFYRSHTMMCVTMCVATCVHTMHVSCVCVDSGARPETGDQSPARRGEQNKNMTL